MVNLPSPTLEVYLACIHADDAVAASDPLVDRAQQLLDSVAWYYAQESRDHLADVTVRAYQLVITAHRPVLFLDFLTTIEQTVASTTTKGLPFDEACSMVVAMLVQQTS